MEQDFGRHRDTDALAVFGDSSSEPTPVGRSKRRPRPVHVLIAAVAMLALAAGSVYVGGRLLVSRYVGSVHQEHLLGGSAVTPSVSTRPKTDQVKSATNLLLVGIDERTNDPAGGARSDSVIIAHIPASHDRAYLISIPRDSRVDIPAYPKTGYAGGTDKINAAFAYGFLNQGGNAGGFELLALTIKQFTGISFNAGALINFDGLRDVVDAVGGIDMCVDEETPVSHPVSIPGVRSQSVYHVGCQHLNGQQALDYVHERYSIPDGDYGRQRHQQQLIAAIVKKITITGTFADPFAADRALRGMGKAVTFDGNGTSLTDWIFSLKSINPDTITMVKTNGGQYTTQVIGGEDFEILTATSRQLFSAVRDDTLDAFISEHPDWVISNANR
jgi:LCP family protein required for cell wall assembly